MEFYQLNKEERIQKVTAITEEIQTSFSNSNMINILTFLSDSDTYIRKTAYIAIGRLYFRQPSLRNNIIVALQLFMNEPDFKIRQTTVNAAGEIGIRDFETVVHFFDTGLFDAHHSVRNAVIGSVKKMGEKNPKPVLQWAYKYLHHSNKEIRREICHGIELRGRTHPQDILPLLKELQFDKTARVRNTLVHVLGQIAYKKGCLETAIADLKNWENKEVVKKAIEEIIDVHHRYRNFAALSQEEAKVFIQFNSPL